jgi:hypothetical protein
MSNRLEADHRIPFIADIDLADSVARTITETKEQADALRSFGGSMGAAIRALPWALADLSGLAREAAIHRDSCAPEFPGTRFVTNRLPEPSARVRFIGTV